MPARLARPFALLIVFALLLAACVAPVAAPAAEAPAEGDAAAAAGDATEITYFTFSAAPDHLDALDEMIAAFEAANPSITVKVETAPFADYFTKLQTLVAGGTAPDVIELNYENFISYAAKGVLADLSDLAADTEFTGRFYPRAYEAFSLDGVQYGLPQSFSNVVLFYNKDLFDAAGLAYPTADWTWAEELEAAKALTNAETGVWGSYSPVQFWEFYKTAAQSGCSVFSADRTTVTINEPGCVESLQWMVDKINTHKIAPSDADMAGVSDGDLFKQGKIAMWRTGIWMFSGMADAPFAWDIALEPGNTQKAHHFFANAVAVSATSPNQEAAREWAKFFTADPDAARIRVAANWELPALNDQALFDEWLAITPPASRTIVFEALETLVTPPVIEQQAQMQDAVNRLLEQAKLGELTPQEALDQAKTEIEALLP